MDAAPARPADDRRRPVDRAAARRGRADRRAARREGAERPGCSSARRPADRRRDPRRRARRPRGSRGSRAGRVPRRAAWRGSRSRGPASSATTTVRDAAIRSPSEAAEQRHRLRPARAAAGAVRLDVDPRELRHADARPGHALRLAASARHARRLRGYVDQLGIVLGLARATRSPRSPAATSRRCDRPLAGGRAAGAAAQRPDARHRHRRQARPVRAARRGSRARAWRWSCCRPSSTSTSS